MSRSLGRYQFIVFKSNNRHPYFISDAVDFDTMIADLSFMGVEVRRKLSGLGLDAYCTTVYPKDRPFGIRRVEIRSFSVLGGDRG